MKPRKLLFFIFYIKGSNFNLPIKSVRRVILAFSIWRFYPEPISSEVDELSQGLGTWVKQFLVPDKKIFISKPQFINSKLPNRPQTSQNFRFCFIKGAHHRTLLRRLWLQTCLAWDGICFHFFCRVHQCLINLVPQCKFLPTCNKSMIIGLYTKWPQKISQ